MKFNSGVSNAKSAITVADILVEEQILTKDEQMISMNFSTIKPIQKNGNSKRLSKL